MKPLIVPTILLLVALLHALPLAGVLGAAPLQKLYGLPVAEPNLELLLRHRALLFGLMAAALGGAAFKPALHGPALVAAGASVGGFLLLAWLVGGINPQLATVVRLDLAALALLAVAGAVHLARPAA